MTEPLGIRPLEIAPGDADPFVSLPDPTVLIGLVLPSLSAAERRVADRILENPRVTLSLNISALAKDASTSEATVVRFAKRVGFAGYPDLRVALAAEVGRSTAEGLELGSGAFEIGPDESLRDIVHKVGALDARAINDTIAHLNVEVLARAVDAIAAASRIEIYGIGASGLVAVDLGQKLRRIGLVAAVSTDGHAALTSAAVLPSDGVAIAISHSGTTLDVIDPMALARSRGATTLAITNSSLSKLADIADLVLTTAVRESTFRAAAMASRSAQLTIVDCVYVAIAQTRYDDAVAALLQTSDAVQSRRYAGSRSQ